MKRSLKTGLCFGLTSGIITTLGLIVGLHSGTHSKIVVLGGILTIAIADAFSDALGIHISEESDKKNTTKEVWEATISTWFSKFFFALTFLVPIILFELQTAITISVAWGVVALGALSYFAAKKGEKIKAVAEHVFIAIIVVLITHFVGDYISKIFMIA